VSPSEAGVAAMAAYMRAVAARLAAQPLGRLGEGTVEFGPAEPLRVAVPGPAAAGAA
jgi:hypothetical protein